MGILSADWLLMRNIQAGDAAARGTKSDEGWGGVD
jgi:hypothetical protein